MRWVKPKKGDSWGYWFTTPYNKNNTSVWFIDYGGGIGYSVYTYKSLGVCPVVCLPFDIDAKILDGVWTVIK